MTDPQNPQSGLPPYPGQPAPPSGTAGPPAPPYGAPTYQTGSQPQGDPNVRPGAVTAAAWITIVLSALSLITFLGLLSVTSRFVDYVFEHPEDFDVQTTDLPEAADLSSALSVLSVIFIVISAIGILVAFATLKRQGWARIVLAILSTLTALVSILPSLLLVGLPWLAGSITVIVLLFTRRSNVWFQGSRTQK